MHSINSFVSVRGIQSTLSHFLQPFLELSIAYLVLRNNGEANRILTVFGQEIKQSFFLSSPIGLDLVLDKSVMFCALLVLC